MCRTRKPFVIPHDIDYRVIILVKRIRFDKKLIDLFIYIDHHDVNFLGVILLASSNPFNPYSYWNHSPERQTVDGGLVTSSFGDCPS